MGYVFSGKYSDDKSVPRETKRRLTGAGTTFGQAGRKNRRYAAGILSHTVASRETVLTVSTPIGFESRLFFGEIPNPLSNLRSLFSGLMYCYDCKAKMHFAAARSMTRKQEHFRCSHYKSGRGECTMHYIRDVMLEQIVLEAISDLADFVRCYEPVFLYMLAKKNNAMRQKEYRRLQQAVENGTGRIAEIDRLIEKVFEQNAAGVLSDERFAKMLQSYEKEQKALAQEVAENQQTLQNAEQQVVDLRLVLRTLREMTDIKELTPTLVNSLIERIEVHNNDKHDGHCHVKVDIYFTAVGMIDIPTEKEILATMEEIRNNPQDFKFVA